MPITQQPHGGLLDGTVVRLYTISNAQGASVTISTYGATITSLKVPDRTGAIGEIVLGFDTLDAYLGIGTTNPYFGAIIGRFANRIKGGKFTLLGHQYTLAINNNNLHHLHGGKKGFDKVVWTAVPGENGSYVDFHYVSPDGEEGYPGELMVSVRYTFTENNELTISYEATTNTTTIVNLTNHTYFNLAGDGNGEVLRHQVQINADFYTPNDSTLIPTGEIRSVEATPFDFRTPHAIGDRIAEVDGGYDHNFAVRKIEANSFEVCAIVTEETSGRKMQVSTTQPGVQFYTGNFLNGSAIGRGATPYNKHAGFCLETQHFPDTPNKSQFPSVTLKPGQTYEHITTFSFSTF